MDNAGSNKFDPMGTAFDEARAAATRGEVPVATAG
jgi:hypothetical protein